MSTVSPFAPLQQGGVRALRPGNVYVYNRAPTAADFEPYVGDCWVNLNVAVYTLVGKPGNVAIWKTSSTAGNLDTLSADDANTAVPVAGDIVIHGGTSLTTTAAGNTITISISPPITVAQGGTGATTLTGVLTGNGAAAFTASAITDNAVQIGAAGNTLSSMPLGTQFQVLHSGGAGSPDWTTATYPATTTKDQILYSSAANTVSEITTAIDGVLITSHLGVPSILANDAGKVLTSNAGAPPSWQAFSSTGITTVVRQVFAANGTYTPTAGMVYCDVEIVGGGGGGGSGRAPSSGGAAGFGGGGGSGGYSRKVFDAATIGVSKAVTIGAGGAGGVPPSDGSTGGTTSFGALLSATGGTGGYCIAPNPSRVSFCPGGYGGIGAGGDFETTGAPGGVGMLGSAIEIAIGGVGGSSYFGGGANGPYIGSFNSGINGFGATSYGGGGSGAASTVQNTVPTYSGGAGYAGVCIVTEYVI